MEFYTEMSEKFKYLLQCVRNEVLQVSQNTEQVSLKQAPPPAPERFLSFFYCKINEIKNYQ